MSAADLKFPPNTGKQWDAEQDSALRELVAGRLSVEQIANELGRTKVGIEARIKTLRLRFAPMHTPGPWKVQTLMVIAPTGETVVHCGTNGFRPPRPYESTANASLIALAPEMYDFIQELALKGNDEEPDIEDYDDTETASSKGYDRAVWELAESARFFLKSHELES